MADEGCVKAERLNAKVMKNRIEATPGSMLWSDRDRLNSPFRPVKVGLPRHGPESFRGDGGSKCPPNGENPNPAPSHCVAVSRSDVWERLSCFVLFRPVSGQFAVIRANSRQKNIKSTDAHRKNKVEFKRMVFQSIRVHPCASVVKIAEMAGGP
jgi:hypothetical protein